MLKRDPTTPAAASASALFRCDDRVELLFTVFVLSCCIILYSTSPAQHIIDDDHAQDDDLLLLSSFLDSRSSSHLRLDIYFYCCIFIFVPHINVETDNSRRI